MPAVIPAAHPLWVRVVHWINALAFFVLLTSGWQIYNADPFWSAPFPSWLTLGGSLPGALQWHFSAMWVLAGNGLVAITFLARNQWPLGAACSAHHPGPAG